jgi:hypothetical protein
MTATIPNADPNSTATAPTDGDQATIQASFEFNLNTNAPTFIPSWKKSSDEGE